MPLAAQITMIICVALVAICLINMIGDVIATMKGYEVQDDEEEDDDDYYR